ncbi:MAG: nitroreductase family protein [Desulfitobacteriaceae bacterium]|nr:nitroreductase family protein [Desulfitobacteriaceae bacterium]MDD4752349.1 nitroreductase family protein [Desulfitobacteriaceae bacterium]
MNEVINTILTRRSIRKYTGESVPEEMVTVLLQAAMSAPTARNQRPWQFIVIRDHETLRKIPDSHPYSGPLYSADMAILVCADKKLIKSEGFWGQDCSAATENILIAAHSLGLGGVWMGVYPKEELMRPLATLFGLPDHVMPFSLIGLGFPAETKSESEKFDQSRVHYNKWNRK